MDDHRGSAAAKAGYVVVTILLAVVVLGSSVVYLSEVVGIVRGGEAFFGGRSLFVDAELPQNTIKSLPPGVKLRHDPAVTLEVPNATAKQRLLALAANIGPLVLLAGALWLLRGLAKSVTQGDPFGPANVARLRRLGVLLLVGAPVVELVNFLLRLQLSMTLPEGQFGDIGFPGLNVPGVPMLAGLGALILAEVFAQGVRLRDDVEGTV